MEWNLDQTVVLVDKKVTDCHCQTWKLHSICFQAKLKKIVKKAAKKIVDDKLQSEDVLQEL